MSDLKKAQDMILGATPVLGHESVPILEALQSVLARDIIAAEDLPASDISAMDGYAVRHTCLRGATQESPARLRIIGESPAGNPCGSPTKRAYEKKKMNPFSRIDSFNYEHGGNQDHQRASQVPLQTRIRKKRTACSTNMPRPTPCRAG